MPMPITIAVANAPSGTTISGPMSIAPLGVSAVSWNCELYLRTLAQRARRRDGSIVRPHRLAGYRQPQPGAAGLVGNVGLPDRLQATRRDPFAVVGDRDAYRVPVSHFHRS